MLIPRQRTEVIHALLDLYTSACAALPASMSSTHAPLHTGAANFTPISPATPASPSEPPSSDDALLGRPGSASRSRSLPSHAFSPPPLGVLAWLNDPAPSPAHGFGAGERTPHEFIQEATQLKIALRGREDARVKNDWALLGRSADEAASASEEERRELKRAERRRRVAAIASEVRELDRGGIRGVPEGGEEVKEEEEKSREKKVTLTRFLF